MYKRRTLLIYVFLILTAAFFFVGCSDGSGGGGASNSSGGKSDTGQNHTDEKRTTLTEFLTPNLSGEVVFEDGPVSIDASNTGDGYMMIRYTGDAEKTKLQITTPDSTVYTYTLSPGEYETFPLSGGDGTYTFDVLEHAYENKYALIYSQPVEVTLNDEFKPFLYPNQYVWFTPDSKAVQKGMDISKESSNDLDYVEQIYHYVIENITYDEELAANISVDYLPEIDRTLESGKGICFDYTSLMASLLRSQGVPTKLVVGYSGTAYHAWISVYLKEIGWVSNIIEFNGESWSLMDPTLAANNASDSVAEYIGDGSNYTVKYSY